MSTKTIQITSKLLAREKGATEVWWTRQRLRLLEAGVLRKVGRKFFGKPRAVDAWLEGTQL